MCWQRENQINVNAPYKQQNGKREKNYQDLELHSSRTNVFLIRNTSTENMSSTNTSKYHGWSGPLLLIRASRVLASSKIVFRDYYIVKYSWHDKYKMKWMDTTTEPISHVYPQGNAAPYRMGIIMGYFLEYGGRILVIFDWNILPVALVTKQNKLFYL